MAEMQQARVAETKFQPYVPPDQIRPEFTFRAIFFGGLFGILFGAVTVYVGLRAGLTVSASIPIAVLSISVLRALGKASILENNIVQTTGSAGESVAGGVIFTLPALIFLGFPLEYARIFLLAFIGGWLFTHMGWHAPWTGLAGTIFVAFIGALILLAILHLLHAATYRRPVY